MEIVASQLIVVFLQFLHYWPLVLVPLLELGILSLLYHLCLVAFLLLALSSEALRLAAALLSKVASRLTSSL